MTIEITDVVEAAIKTDDLGCAHIVYKHPAGMADADLDEEVIKGFIRHQLKVPAERGYAQVTYRGDLLQGDVFLIIGQGIGANLI